MSEEPKKQIALPIVGKPNNAERMYGKIALEHGKLEHVQQLAKLGNGQVKLNPVVLLLHLEASVAFLAEELLRLKERMETKIED